MRSRSLGSVAVIAFLIFGILGLFGVAGVLVFLVVQTQNQTNVASNNGSNANSLTTIPPITQQNPTTQSSTYQPLILPAPNPANPSQANNSNSNSGFGANSNDTFNRFGQGATGNSTPDATAGSNGTPASTPSQSGSGMPRGPRTASNAPTKIIQELSPTERELDVLDKPIRTADWITGAIENVSNPQPPELDKRGIMNSSRVEELLQSASTKLRVDNHGTSDLSKPPVGPDLEVGDYESSYGFTKPARYTLNLGDQQIFDVEMSLTDIASGEVLKSRKMVAMTVIGSDRDSAKNQPLNMPTGAISPEVCFPVTTNGYFVTANSCVADSKRIWIDIHGVYFPAIVVAKDPKLDLALIKADVDNIMPVPFGTVKPLLPGDSICSVSGVYPMMVPFPRFGMVREIVPLDDGLEVVLLEDAGQYGHRGSAVFDRGGRVIGINVHQPGWHEVQTDRIVILPALKVVEFLKANGIEAGDHVKAGELSASRISDLTRSLNFALRSFNKELDATLPLRLIESRVYHRSDDKGLSKLSYFEFTPDGAPTVSYVTANGTFYTINLSGYSPVQLPLKFGSVAMKCFFPFDENGAATWGTPTGPSSGLAGYGPGASNPSGYPGGLPGGYPGGPLGGSPSGYPGGYPGGATGGYPGGAPGGYPGSGIPGSGYSPPPRGGSTYPPGSYIPGSGVGSSRGSQQGPRENHRIDTETDLETRVESTYTANFDFSSTEGFRYDLAATDRISNKDGWLDSSVVTGTYHLPLGGKEVGYRVNLTITRRANRLQDPEVAQAIKRESARIAKIYLGGQAKMEAAVAELKDDRPNDYVIARAIEDLLQETPTEDRRGYVSQFLRDAKAKVKSNKLRLSEPEKLLAARARWCTTEELEEVYLEYAAATQPPVRDTSVAKELFGREDAIIVHFALREIDRLEMSSFSLIEPLQELFFRWGNQGELVLLEQLLANRNPEVGSMLTTLLTRTNGPHTIPLLTAWKKTIVSNQKGAKETLIENVEKSREFKYPVFD